MLPRRPTDGRKSSPAHRPPGEAARAKPCRASRPSPLAAHMTSHRGPVNTMCFGSVLPLEKAKREAAAQRRPAKTKRKNRVFREMAGRMVWSAKRFKPTILYLDTGSAFSASMRGKPFLLWNYRKVYIKRLTRKVLLTEGQRRSRRPAQPAARSPQKPPCAPGSSGPSGNAWPVRTFCRQNGRRLSPFPVWRARKPPLPG